MNYAPHVEVELARAERLTAKDKKQRWVTLDGAIHETPVPYRDAVSVRWMPIVGVVAVAYRDRVTPHPASPD